MEVFRFYLMKNATTYYGVGSNGNITESNIIYRLKYPPLDWREAEVVSKASDSKWIPRREFTTPIQFVRDGARILSSLLFTHGITAKCILRIEKLDTYSQSYNLWYQGDVDFTTFEEDDVSVTVSLVERGLVGTLVSRRNTPYEIELKQSDPTIFLDGVKLNARAEWILGDSEELSAVDYEMGTTIARSIPCFPFGSNIQAGNFLSPMTSSTSGQKGNFLNPYTSLFFGTMFAVAVATESWLDVNIYGQLPLGFWFNTSWMPSSSRPYAEARIIVKASAWRYTPPSQPVNYGTYIIGTSDWYSGDTWHYPYVYLNGDIPFFPKDCHMVLTVELETRFTDPDLPNSFDLFEQDGRIQFFADTSIFRLRYNARVAPTRAKGIRYIEFLDRFIKEMTDGQYGAVSNYLTNTDTSPSFRFKNFDNSPFNTMVTSGLSLRGVSEAVIKTKFSDIEQDAWSRWGLDWTVEGNNIRFEPLEYFFNDNMLFEVNLVKNMTVTPLVDKVFNNLDVGYTDRDNDIIGGREEFNIMTSYLAKDNDVIDNTESLITPYRADVYGIESVRAKTADEESKDNKGDNDVFLIEIDPRFYSDVQAYKPLKFSNFDLVGITDKKDMYNIALSPKRMLYRHMRRLVGMKISDVLTFQTSERNSELESTLWSGTIIENSDVDLTSTSWSYQGMTHNFSPLFQPFIIEVDCVPPYDLLEILSINNRGYVKFTYKGVIVRGFILDIGVKPATMDSYRLKILSYKNNDLSLIKRYY